MKTNSSNLFLITALVALTGSIVWGVVASWHYLYPDSSRLIQFHHSRPIHTALALSWIFTAAMGGIYYYLRDKISHTLASAHLILFVTAGCLIMSAYLMGNFSGREYLEFPPLFSLLLFAGWILFGINVLPLIWKNLSQQPVYHWMWGLGILFFIYTLAESYFWLIPWFNENIIRDITVQWKAMGAMVGSWNLLVYGTAIYIMHAISKDRAVAFGRLPFALFFLGLINLMFNWGHHTYNVPAQLYVREIAYLISMTELIILGKIIFDWRKKLVQRPKIPGDHWAGKYRMAGKFMVAADVWIFLCLVQAILMSVPALNIYIHGTHVVVAHAMGTTIGINTMILLSSIFYILAHEKSQYLAKSRKLVGASYYVLQFSLFVFWVSLSVAGVIKGYLTYHGGTLSFQEIMARIYPWLYTFYLSGIVVFMALAAISFTLIFTIIPVKAKRLVLSPSRWVLRMLP